MPVETGPPAPRFAARGGVEVWSVEKLRVTHPLSGEPVGRVMP